MIDDHNRPAEIGNNAGKLEDYTELGNGQVSEQQIVRGGFLRVKDMSRNVGNLLLASGVAFALPMLIGEHSNRSVESHRAAAPMSQGLLPDGRPQAQHGQAPAVIQEMLKEERHP